MIQENFADLPVRISGAAGSRHGGTGAILSFFGVRLKTKNQYTVTFQCFSILICKLEKRRPGQWGLETVMMKVWFRIALGALAIALAGQRVLAEANNAAMLTEKLTQYYKPVKPGIPSGASSPGSAPRLLTVRLPGVLGLAVADASFLDACPSIFRMGRIHQSPGFFCSELANKSQRKLRVSERVYVTNILVSSTYDRVSLYLAACGDCTPRAEQGAYRSLVVFEFSKGYVSKAGLTQIVHTIDEVFTAGAVAADSAAPTAPAPANPEPAAPSERAAEAPATPAATPPPAVAGIVKKGQTPDVVERILGKPLVIFDLGTKVVYVYPNMKVFYVGGKLADVQ
jgi:hypothetical protein